MAASDCHVLFIAEVQATADTPEGQRAWMVELTLDDDPKSRTEMPLHDPFSEDQHRLCRQYLNFEHLKKRKALSLADAALQSEAIHGYRGDLFGQLELDQLQLEKSILKILIAERPEAVGSTYTIHCLHWESLESLDLWAPMGVTEVTVRRFVNVEDGHSLERSNSWRHSGRGVHNINVLLVIARTFGEGVERETPPSQVQNAILRSQGRLRSKEGPYRINMEIARPGTYEAFQHYLHQRKGYFNLVHFDVHGRIEEKEVQTPLAKLRFVDYNRPDKPHDVEGQKVAELLVEHGIYCAVINACDSGRAIDGIDANLSRVFVQAGVSNVLAMSYQFTTTAALLFHQSLYDALFIERVPFSDAARIGRRALSNEPKRRGHDLVIADMQDWVIPVVYSHSNARDVRIEPTVTDILVTEAVSLSQRTFLLIWVRYLIGLCFGFVYLVKHIAETMVSSSTSPHIQCISGPQCHLEEYVELDFDVLRFEDDLIADRLVYFYGTRLTQKSRLMRCLSRLWCVTGLLKQVYIVQSSWFLAELDYLETLRHRFLGGDLLHRIPLPSPKDDGPFWTPKTLIIIDQIDDLFDDGMKDPTLTHARQRLFDFLEKMAQRDMKAKFPLPRVFIVIVGRQDDPEWWETHFKQNRPNLDGPNFYRHSQATFDAS